MHAAVKSIHHRGPDDDGIFVSSDKDTHLGHVRLSIIDLSSAGHQPMHDHSGRYTMVFNGEIYNFIELRSQIESEYGSVAWKSDSDSEVIIEGFAREGERFLSRLNGIFALAIYDHQIRTMHVLRDPVGIKPLYVTRQNGTIYFSSEIKGILAFPQVKGTLRHASLRDQLAFMYVPEPHTMYNEILRVKPGICYSYKDGKQVGESYLFQHLFNPISFHSEQEMLDKFHDTLHQSVKRQLIADVPVSLFLSGGVDSSTIAYEAVQAGAKIKTAYTISFSDADTRYDQQSSDLHYAAKMADILGLKLNVIEAQADFISLLPELIPFMEDGISDPAAINTWLICKSAREDGVKVMLSGQGADEYLCGYRRYRAEQMIQGLSPLKRKMIQQAGKIFPASIPGKLNSMVRRLHKLANAAGLNERERLISYFNWAGPELLSGLFIDSNEQWQNPLGTYYEQHKSSDMLSDMLVADQHFDLRSLNLAYTDKMSMSVALEVRVPFLDFELVRLMNAVPLDMKMRNGELKYILKKAMEKKLPDEVIYRQKAGFALPIRSWLRKRNEMVNHYLNEDRLGKQGIFHVGKMKELLHDHYSGKSDYSYLLFTLLCQQIWLDYAGFGSTHN